MGCLWGTLRLLSTMVAEPSSALEPVEASAYKGARGEIRAERLTCTYQQQGRPRLVGAADGYSYLREGAMGEPGRPGSAVERCPHDPKSWRGGRGSWPGGRAAAAAAHVSDA